MPIENRRKEKIPKEVLTNEQIEKSLDWYKIHEQHVKTLCLNERNEFAPSLYEDKNNPNLWKPGHWKWFLKYFNI